jgi:hypothetical protein
MSWVRPSTLSKNSAQTKKPADLKQAGGFGMSVRVSLDHARTQTTSLLGRLARFRVVVSVVRIIEVAV